MKPLTDRQKKVYLKELRIYTKDNGTLVDLCPKVTDGNPIHAANLRHFADVLLNGAEPDFTPEQGVDMIKILRAMYESAESGREVRL